MGARRAAPLGRQRGGAGLSEAAAPRTGATLAAQTLLAHEVTTVFTLCGDHTNPMADAMAEAGIRIVDTRDERGAAWMAAGWALATGEPGVVMVSGAPALTNAATALADATASGHPVVCLSGAIATPDRGKGHPGDVDHTAIAAPLSKWSGRAGSADGIGIGVASALRAAKAARPGAATLEVPLDVQYGATDEPVPRPRTLERPSPDAAAIDAARRLLSTATKPVIVAGSGVFWSGAGETLMRLVERARIPVFTVRAARGIVSDEHELCFGFPNLLSQPAQTIFAEADVALVVGCELDVLVAGGGFHPGCQMIRVDADPKAFTLGRRAELPVVADPRTALAQLADGAQPLPTHEWVARLRDAENERQRDLATRKHVASWPFHPGRLVAEIDAKIPKNAIVCVDAGALALWAIDGIAARAPSSMHVSSASGLGALGMGLPWAIGMKLAQPSRPVLALVGDGSFGFTAMELETATRHDAPVAVVVGNDGGWGIVRQLQERLHGRAVASDLPRSPYELLAEFAGGVGDIVENQHHLQFAITNALAAKVPAVVNVPLDHSVEHAAIGLIAAMFDAKRSERG